MDSSCGDKSFHDTNILSNKVRAFSPNSANSLHEELCSENATGGIVEWAELVEDTDDEESESESEEESEEKEREKHESKNEGEQDDSKNEEIIRKKEQYEKELSDLLDELHNTKQSFLELNLIEKARIKLDLMCRTMTTSHDQSDRFKEFLDDLDVLCFIAAAIQDSSAPLESLSMRLFSQLREDDTDPRLLNEMKDKVPLIAERKNYGKKLRNLIIPEDMSEGTMWIWEVINLDLLPQRNVNSLRASRKYRKQVSQQITVLERLQKILSSKRIDKAKLSIEEERITKFKRQAELSKQRDATRRQKELEKELRERKKREEDEARRLKRQKEQEEKDRREKEREAEREERIRKKLEERERKDKEKVKKVAQDKPVGIKQITTFFTKAKDKDPQPLTEKNGSESEEQLKRQQTERIAYIDKAIKEQQPLSLIKDQLAKYMKQAAKRYRQKKFRQTKVHLPNDCVILNNPVEENCNSMEDEFETVHVAQSFNNLKKSSDCVKDRRMKLLQFHDNYRPTYFGTYSKTSTLITGRTPFSRDITLLNYEEDSDEEWYEDEPGESLSSCDEGEEQSDKEEQECDFYINDGWLIPDDAVEVEEMQDDDLIEPKQSLKRPREKMDRDESKKQRNNIEPRKPLLIGIVRNDKIIAGEVVSDNPAFALCGRLRDYRIQLIQNLPRIKFSAMDPFSTKRGSSKSLESWTEDCKTNDAETPNPRRTARIVPDELLPQLISLINLQSIGVQRAVIEFVKLHPQISKRQTEQKILELFVKDKREGDTKPVWHIKPEFTHLLQLAPIEITCDDPKVEHSPTPVSSEQNQNSDPEICQEVKVDIARQPSILDMLKSISPNN